MSSFRIDLPSIRVPASLRKIPIPIPKDNHSDMNQESNQHTNQDNNHDINQDINHNINRDITTTLAQQPKESTEDFHSELNLESERLKKVEKRLDDLILGRVPVSVSKSHTEEILSLRNGLHFERRKRMENENKFLEEMGRLRLKVEVMEGRIKKSGTFRQFPSTSDEPGNGEIAKMITDLFRDIRAKFLKFHEWQIDLQRYVKRMTEDMEYLNLVITPPVEAILEAQPEPPLGTPVLNLYNWGVENLDEILTGLEQSEVEPIPTAIDDDVSKTTKPSNANVKRSPIEPLNDEKIVVVHKKASTAGQYFPFMCQCGLEFDSEDSLSKHAEEEAAGQEKSAREIPATDADADDNLFIKLTPTKLVQSEDNKPSPKTPKQYKAMPGSKKRLFTPDKSKPCGNLTSPIKQSPTQLYSVIQVESKEIQETSSIIAPISNNELGLSEQVGDDTSTEEPSQKPSKLKKLLLTEKSKPRGKLTSTPKRPPNSCRSKAPSQPKQVQEASSDAANDLLGLVMAENGKPKEGPPSKPRIMGKGMPLSKKLHLMSQKSRRHGNQPSTFPHQPPINSTQLEEPKMSSSRPNPNSTNQHGLCEQMKDENGISKFYCKCGKSYSQRTGLTRHIDCLRRKLKCNLCPKEYPSWYTLRKHMEGTHKVANNLKGKIFCYKCQLVFDNKERFADHRKEFHTEVGNEHTSVLNSE